MKWMRTECAHFSARACLSAVLRLLPAQSLPTDYALPKIYRKVYYSISAAIHSRVVRVRNAKERRNREPPRRFPNRDQQQQKKD